MVVVHKSEIHFEPQLPSQSGLRSSMLKVEGIQLHQGDVQSMQIKQPHYLNIIKRKSKLPFFDQTSLFALSENLTCFVVTKL